MMSEAENAFQQQIALLDLYTENTSKIYADLHDSVKAFFLDLEWKCSNITSDSYTFSPPGKEKFYFSLTHLAASNESWIKHLSKLIESHAISVGLQHLYTTDIYGSQICLRFYCTLEQFKASVLSQFKISNFSEQELLQYKENLSKIIADTASLREQSSILQKKREFLQKKIFELEYTVNNLEKVLSFKEEV